MVQVDAHQHYWNPGRGDYHWMPKDDPVLCRTYGPADLTPALAATGVTHTVLVQAAATVEESEYMLGIADVTEHVAGVVGWVDFERPEHMAHLERLAGHPKFLGVRPMIQDIPDVDWMLRDDVQWGFEAVCDLGLSFDALGFPQHLANFQTLLSRYPDMRVVVDHCMKPQIRDPSDANFKPWADGMSRLAEKGAYCKLSGLVTEAKEDWSADQLRPYASHVLSAFGPERVMWGSDWPVVRLRAEYERWRSAAMELTAELSPEEQARVFGATAVEFYGLAV